MTYILILTLMVEFGSTIAIIEFSTKERCELAAKAWLKEGDRFSGRKHTVCVQK